MIRQYKIEHKRNRDFLVLPPCNWEKTIKLFGQYMEELFGKNSFKDLAKKWNGDYTLNVNGIELKILFLARDVNSNCMQHIRICIYRSIGNRFEKDDDIIPEIVLHVKRNKRINVTDLKQRISKLVKDYKDTQFNKNVAQEKAKFQRIATAGTISKAIEYDVNVENRPDELYIVNVSGVSDKHKIKIRRTLNFYDLQFTSQTPSNWTEDYIIENKTLHEIKLLIPIIKEMLKISDIGHIAKI